MLILLYKGVSPISRLIRFRASRVMWLGDMSDRSHASIVASDGYRTHVDMGTMPAYLATCPMYEAWHRRVMTVPGGVRRRVGIGAAHTLHTRVDIYKLDDAFVDVDAVRRFLAAQGFVVCLKLMRRAALCISAIAHSYLRHSIARRIPRIWIRWQNCRDLVNH
jgi:ABC-type taurine transport system ATPase subunit